jgi:hypothetical protein
MEMNVIDEAAENDFDKKKKRKHKRSKFLFDNNLIILKRVQEAKGIKIKWENRCLRLSREVRPL